MSAPAITQTDAERQRVAHAVRSGFESALGVEIASDTDDFFELGGDSLMALSLFQHVEQTTGQTLPITAIYDAPTIEKLTERLLSGGPSPRLTCLVELRPAKGRHPGPPLFLLHGLGGSVMILRDLATRIGGIRAVWGIEAQGMDGISPPLEQVEAMAARYLEDVRTAAPKGPYLLAGYSFGGLVAYEMARQLVQAGEEVAMLAMLDTFPHPSTWRLSSRLRALWLQTGVYVSPKIWLNLGKRHFAKLHSRSPAAALRHLVRGLWRAITLPTDIMRTAWVHEFAGRAGLHRDMLVAYDSKAIGAANQDAIERVTNAARIAFQSYRPQKYPGKLVALRAIGQQAVPFEASAIWGHMVNEIVVMETQTDHLSIVRGEAAATAAQLTAAIDASLAERPV